MPFGFQRVRMDKPVVWLPGLLRCLSGAGAAWPFTGCQGFPTVPSLSTAKDSGLFGDGHRAPCRARQGELDLSKVTGTLHLLAPLEGDTSSHCPVSLGRFSWHSDDEGLGNKTGFPSAWPPPPHLISHDPKPRPSQAASIPVSCVATQTSFLFWDKKPSLLSPPLQG